MATSAGTEENRIEEEWKLVDAMVLSAKHGNWDTVFKILQKAPQVINLIPENRRWGVLHQAVWWNNKAILKRVLMSTGCDPGLKSKTCSSDKGQTEGKIAAEIANMYGYGELEQILRNSRLKISVDENNTFAPYSSVLINKGLLSIGLAGFKKTFHPSPVDKSRSVILVLEDAFKRMNSSDTSWQVVRDQVCDTLVIVNSFAMESIKSSSSTRKEFFISIVNDYTRENTYLYDHANSALRRQREANYIPSAEDLALAPYIIVYMMLLLFWPNLKRESVKTYRKVRLSKAQADQYKVGTKFTWLGFVSSSVELEKAIPFPTCNAQGDNIVIFEMDNSTMSLWQPRDIEQYACYQERERVYPSGARFEVTGRKQQRGKLLINLKLIN